MTLASAPVWCNGSLVDADQATVSVFDHGITVGEGVFETLKVVNGIPFALRRHLTRLRRSAAGLGIEIGGDDDALRRAAMEVAAAAAGSPLARLRITATGGPSPLGSGRGDCPTTLIMAIGDLEPVAPSTDVVTVGFTRNERAATVGLKTTSYVDNVMALAQAQRRGATEALLANTTGQLCEGAGSNVFVVLDGVLCTPALRSGCLAGITRELVIEVVGDISETDLDLDVLERAEEVFLTSSTRDVQAVAHIDGVGIGETPGPITGRAAAAFAELIASRPDP